jgi:hypothetical protein
MSLIKKSDVKSHLSTATSSVYPFGLKRTDTKTSPESNDFAQADGADISISPSHHIASDTIPNAQVGGSVGVPAGAETLRKSDS